MFIEELKKEYDQLTKLELSMLKRRMALESAWSNFSEELSKAEYSNITDKELERLYDKNDKFGYVYGIACDRERNIGLLLDKMASIIDTYDEYERRHGRA